MCGMMLADYGATVIRVDAPSAFGIQLDLNNDRGKKSIVLNLKDPTHKRVLKQIAAKADAFIESFRPGVLEKLGLGPAEMHAVNKRLVYARLSGYG